MSAESDQQHAADAPAHRASRPPRTVVNAVRLMYAGAALELATLITIVATADSVKAAILNSHPAA